MYQYSLSYYPNSNVWTDTDSSQGNPVVGNWTYTYDNLNRLASAQGAQAGGPGLNRKQ